MVGSCEADLQLDHVTKQILGIFFEIILDLELLVLAIINQVWFGHVMQIFNTWMQAHRADEFESEQYIMSICFFGSGTFLTKAKYL